MPFGSLAQLALGIGGQIASSRANRSSSNNPSRAAEAQLSAIPGAVRPYYDPYIQLGNVNARMPALNQAYQNLFAGPDVEQGALNNQYQSMSQNPTGFMDALMRNYNPSEGYRFKQRQMLDAMRNSASSGGFAGTPFNQQQQAETVQGLLGGDMQQYLQNALGISQGGFQGLESGLNRRENRMLGRERALQSAIGHEEGNIGRGFQAATGLADILSNLAGSRASNEFAGAQRRGQNAQNNIGGWMALGNGLQNSINMFGPAMMGGGGGGGWGGASRGFTPPTGGGYGGQGGYF